jgi:hypothetical protein
MIFIFKDIIVVVLLNMSESSKLEQGSQGEEQELDSEQGSQGEESDQEPEQEQELDSEQGSQGEELDQEPEQEQEPDSEQGSQGEELDQEPEQDQEPEPELDSEQDQEPEPELGSEQGSQGDESDKEQPGGGAPQIAKRKIFILHRWRIVHRYGRFLYVNVKGRLVRLSQIKSMKTKTNKASCSKRAKNTCS